MRFGESVSNLQCRFSDCHVPDLPALPQAGAAQETPTHLQSSSTLPDLTLDTEGNLRDGVLDQPLNALMRETQLHRRSHWRRLRIFLRASKLSVESVT